ncbi:hypothetical protein HWV62_25961 [Athelia sp. TMB]|nr:hypothetical protein HWV62_25961 [Athelia sp. TMB]
MCTHLTKEIPGFRAAPAAGTLKEWWLGMHSRFGIVFPQAPLTVEEIAADVKMEDRIHLEFKVKTQNLVSQQRESGGKEGGYKSSGSTAEEEEAAKEIVDGLSLLQKSLMGMSAKLKLPKRALICLNAAHTGCARAGGHHAHADVTVKPDLGTGGGTGEGAEGMPLRRTMTRFPDACGVKAGGAQ